MKSFLKDLFDEAKPYDLFLVIISTTLGVGFSLIQQPSVAIIMGGIIAAILLFGIVFMHYESKSDYLKLIDKEFKKGRWDNVYHLGNPICATLGRMARYSFRIKVASKILRALNSIDPQNIDSENENEKFEIVKAKSRIYIDDLGFTYFLLKDIEKAKSYTQMGIDIGQQYGVEEVVLRGYAGLVQMLLISGASDYFSEREREEVKMKFIISHNEVESKYSRAFSGNKEKWPNQIKFLCLRSKLMFYRYKKLYENSIYSDAQYLNDIQQLNKELELVKLKDMSYQCKRIIFELQIQKSDKGNIGIIETQLLEIINNAFHSSIAITAVQYVKFVNLYLLLISRKLEGCLYRNFSNNEKKLNYLLKISNDLSVLIKDTKKEIRGMDDVCAVQFLNISKQLDKLIVKSIKNCRCEKC